MSCWNVSERRIFSKLTTPYKVQLYLDALPYNIEELTRSPREMLRAGSAHCFDGALFAAAALAELGYPPLIVDLRSNGKDSDHILAVFQESGCWGAVAKSNFTGCRYRDPVFRSLRELVMSYFYIYFNLAGEKTLREYSQTFDLRKLKDVPWRTTSENLDPLSARLNAVRHFWLINKRQEKHLAPIDDRTFRGETLGLDPRGAHKVKNSKLMA